MVALATFGKRLDMPNCRTDVATPRPNEPVVRLLLVDVCRPTGDAGHHKDPSTGMGMSDAFASAELLAEAIDESLVGRRPLDGALSDYQNKRDALTANGYALTLSTARLAPLTPRLEAFYRAAADQPEAIRRI